MWILSHPVLNVDVGWVRVCTREASLSFRVQGPILVGAGTRARVPLRRPKLLGIVFVPA